MYPFSKKKLMEIEKRIKNQQKKSRGELFEHALKNERSNG